MKLTGFGRNRSKRKTYNINENLLVGFIVAACYLLAELSAKVNHNLAQQEFKHNLRFRPVDRLISILKTRPSPTPRENWSYVH